MKYAIDKDGVLYTFTDYSDWKAIKSKPFQTALSNYKKDLKAFQSVIKGLPKNQKEYVDGVIDKEGFDYAFDGIVHECPYITLEEIFDIEIVKEEF